MITMSSISSAPWSRCSWSGKLVSIDGCDTADFAREDVASVLAFGATDDCYDSRAAGIALLKDGRFIAWETNFNYGSDFHGDANIGFARTVQSALGFIAKAERELLTWNDVAE